VAGSLDSPHQVQWRCVNSFRIPVVHKRVVGVVLSTRIISDIEPLGLEVLDVPDSVFVASGVPDLARVLVANRERETALDQLDAARGALVDGRRDEDVNVIGHDDEAVEGEAFLVAIAEERLDHELGVCSALEDPFTLMRKDREGVGLRLLTDSGHGKDGIPQGLKPGFCGAPGGPRLKPWVTWKQV